MLPPSTYPFSFASVCSFTSRDGFAKDQAAPSAEGAHSTAWPRASQLTFRSESRGCAVCASSAVAQGEGHRTVS